MKKYKIVKILGEGSFGIVVEARKKRTKEKVAIKYISDYDSSEYGAL
jgi:serine/threonine protein kinase